MRARILSGLVMAILVLVAACAAKPIGFELEVKVLLDGKPVRNAAILVDGIAEGSTDAQGRFADLFATVKRAPTALAERLRELPGVADVQTTIEQIVRIRLVDSSDPVLGQLIGVDRLQPPRLNQVTVVAGRGLFNTGTTEGDGNSTGDGGTLDALV